MASCDAVPAAENLRANDGAWSVTGGLPVAFAHGAVAVRLADGRVVVSGGGTPCAQVSKAAALFDPASNTWSSISSMNVARQFHTAILMQDGRVLVTGGALTQDGSVAEAEAYDAATGEWTIVARRPMVQGTACDGYVQSFAALLDPARSIASRATDSTCSSTTMLLAVYDTVGSPWALCITDGAHQYLFSASNPDRTDVTKGELTGEIYQLELDGTIVGRFGGHYNSRGGFKTPHSLDCLSENELVEISITDDFHLIKLLPR